MTTNKYSAGCFGKLPKFADFVKFNSGNNEIILFDKWLQNGLQYSKTTLNTSFDASYSTADTVQFVFPIVDSTNILLGTFISSNDKSGRKYPFIISTPINHSIGPENSHLLPLVFENFFLNSNRTIYKMKEIEKHDDIIAEIEDNIKYSETNFPEKKLQYQEYINATTTNNLWNGIFGDFEDERKYLMFYNLTEILLPLRNKQINNFTLGLKIPIVPENKFFYLNISFWIDVCFKLTGTANIKPFLFWSKKSTETERYLILFLNQPKWCHLL